jgi:hypothetical protein
MRSINVNEVLSVSGGEVEEEGNGAEESFQRFDDGSTLFCMGDFCSSTDATDRGMSYGVEFNPVGCVALLGAVITAIASRGASTTAQVGNAASGAGSGCITITSTPTPSR